MRTFSLLFFSSLFWFSYAFPYVVDKIIIIVDNSCITEYEYKSLYREMRKIVKNPKKAKIETIKRLIADEILYNRATEEYISISDEDVQKEIEKMKKRLGISNDREFKLYLRRLGYSLYDDFWNDVRRKLMIRRAIELLFGGVKQAKITKKEMLSFYRKHLKGKFFKVIGKVIVVPSIREYYQVKDKLTYKNMVLLARKYGWRYYDRFPDKPTEIIAFAQENPIVMGLVLNPKVKVGKMVSVNLGSKGVLVAFITKRRELGFKELENFIRSQLLGKKYMKELNYWLDSIIKNAVIKFIDERYKVKL